MNKLRWLAVLALVVGLIVVGSLYAQKQHPKVSEAKTDIEMSESDTGPGPMGMMMDLPPDVEKKMIEQQMKFRKEIAPIEQDMEQKRMEMRLLWLDEEPSADKIIAKMSEINKIEMQLEEKHIRNRLAVYNILPKENRKQFLRGCCGGMGPGMGMMGQGPMMGMGPQVRVEKRVMKMGSGMGRGKRMMQGRCPGCMNEGYSPRGEE